MDSWEKKEEVESNLKEKFFMKTSMFKKFFIFSIVFFILALGEGWAERKSCADLERT